MTRLFSIAIFISLSLMGLGQIIVFDEVIKAQNFDDYTGKTFIKYCLDYRQVYGPDSIGMNSSNLDSALLLEIIPAKYKRIEKSFSVQEDELNKSYLYKKTKDEAIRLVSGPLQDFTSCRITSDTLPYLLVHITKTPAQYVNFNSKIKSAGTYYYSYDSLISKAYVRINTVVHKPSELDSNQFFLPRGLHPPFREFYCVTCGNRSLVLQVQKALKAAGYKVPEDNVLEKKTRKALIAYQKKHGLPFGNMNVETMKHLGIEGY